MAVRGVVAFGTVASWRGAYNHTDSQPTGLGAQLWPVLVDAADLGAVRERLFRAGRTEAFLRSEVATQPEIWEAADPIAIEWIYIIDIANSQLHVMANAPTDVTTSAFEHILVDTFSIAGAEPDWRKCERKRDRAIGPVMLERIRARFGDDAYESARQQLDED